MSNRQDRDLVRMALAEQLSQQRRDTCRDSILAFGQAYLFEYFKDPPCVMHRELAEVLQAASGKRGRRVAIAAPRGYAKSTLVSLAYVLWSVCYNREQYVVIICDTSAQADDALSFIKKELEENALLLRDFPDVCEPPGSKPGPPRWRQDEIIARNGVKITALGAGQNIRGRRNRESRPGLVILDDVENEEAVRSAEQREKLYDWFTKAVLKAGDRNTNVVVVGTIMHYDSLLARLIDRTKSPGWIGRKYKAILSWPINPELWEYWEKVYNHLETDGEGHSGPEAARREYEKMDLDMLDGTAVLWPEREDFYHLMELRIAEGRASFDSEKMNEPVDPRDCLFQEEDFVFWDADGMAEQDLIASLRGNCTMIGACDPSLGKAGRGRDDSAIITLLRDRKTGVLYVLDADIRRRLPDRIIEDILSYHRIRRYAMFAIEANQFQSLLATELRRQANIRRPYLPLKEITNTSDKLGRIQSLQPMMKSGTIRFSRRDVQLLEQLRQFPKAAHDDGPDALEMAVSLAGSHRRCSLSELRAMLPVVGSSQCPPYDYVELTPGLRVPYLPMGNFGKWW